MTCKKATREAIGLGVTDERETHTAEDEVLAFAFALHE